MSFTQDHRKHTWYPHPAQLTREGSGFSPQASLASSLALRPFEIVLPEAVPAGETPSLNRRFTPQGRLVGFEEPSREIAIAVSDTTSGLAIKGELPKCGTRGFMAVEVRMTKGAFAFMSKDVGKNFDLHGQLAGRDVKCQPVLGQKLAGASCWQAWRIPVEASPEPRLFESVLSSSFEKDVVLTAAAHFVPV